MKLSELEIWKEGRVVRNEISALVKLFPKKEEYRLEDQIIRSSRSVTANIAEGHGRYHYQENIQYCRMARGSLQETFDHLTVALDEGYITRNDLGKLNEKIEILMKKINGYINYLKKRKSEL